LPEPDQSLDEILNEVLRVAIRRRWWVLLPASVIAVGACLTSLLLPKRYASDATILVERQQVPERYVAGNRTTDVREELLGMTDAILSRTQLLQIIDEFALYPKEKKDLAPEQLVDLMRGNIKVEPLEKRAESKDLNAFRISFDGVDPHSAQEVTNALTTLFVKENLKSREEQSTGTTNFLAGELESAAAELKQQEGQVRDFKMRFLGELPEQQQGNLAILTGLHAQLQNTMSTLGRAREQQVYLQSLLSQYDSLAAAGVLTARTMAPSPNETTEAELTRLQNEKAELLARYTANHPDVVKIEEQIKETEALLAATKQAPQPTKDGTLPESTNSARPAESDASTAQIKSQLEANQLEIKNSSEDEKRIEAQIAGYQSRLNLTPVREQQLADLLHGYDRSKQHYDDLLSKKTESELATSLERHQQGQRFNIIDPPSLPMNPSSPSYMKIGLGGLAAGIAVGAALAFLVESRDHSLRREEELMRIFSFPLMVGVPVLLSRADERRRSRVALLEWFVGATLCLLVCAAEFYVFGRG
jgi:polysaccharide chain length determinant protein (PEP-CTERM system associated)